MVIKLCISVLIVINVSQAQYSYLPNWNISYSSLPALPSLPDLPSLPTIPELPGFPSFPTLPSLPNLPTLPPIPDLPQLPSMPQSPFQSLSLPSLSWFQAEIAETTTVAPNPEESWFDSRWSLPSLSPPDLDLWFQDDDNDEDRYISKIPSDAPNSTDWFSSYRSAVQMPWDWIEKYESAVEWSNQWIVSYSRAVNGTEVWLERYGGLLGIQDQWVQNYKYARQVTDASIRKYEAVMGVTEEWYDNYKLAMEIVNNTYSTVDWFVTYKDKLAGLNFTLLDDNWLETYREGLALLQEGMPNKEVFDKYRKAVKIINKAFGVECTNTTITCPNTEEKLEVEVCCSSLWLSVGAPIGLGTECWMDLDQLEEGCSMYSCYRNKQEGNVTNHWNADGCSWVPDVMLNYESCVLHDLCYVTPNMTKAACDEAMLDNINKIYCDNVNPLEQAVCQARASWANTILGFTDKYFMDCAWEREACGRNDAGILLEDHSKDLIPENNPRRKMDFQLKLSENCIEKVTEKEAFSLLSLRREDILDRFTEASFCVLHKHKNETNRRLWRMKAGRRLKKLETTLLLKAHCDNANYYNSSMKESCRNCFREAVRRSSHINKAVATCSKNFLGEKYEKCTYLLANKKKGQGNGIKKCYDNVLMRGIISHCTPLDVTSGDTEAFRKVADCAKEEADTWIVDNTSPQLESQFKSYFMYM